MSLHCETFQPAEIINQVCDSLMPLLRERHNELKISDLDTLTTLYNDSAKFRQIFTNLLSNACLLPICSSCKKIRDDEGYWQQIEEYIRDHSEADFTHGICNECVEELYPEYYQTFRGKMNNDKSSH